MANDIGWGQGAVNNGIGWGQGAINNDINWGDIYYSTDAGETDIIGSEAPAYLYFLNSTFYSVLEETEYGEMLRIGQNFELINYTSPNERGLIWNNEDDNIEYTINFVVAEDGWELTTLEINKVYDATNPFSGVCPINLNTIIYETNGEGLLVSRIFDIYQTANSPRSNGDFISLTDVIDNYVVTIGIEVDYTFEGDGYFDVFFPAYISNNNSGIERGLSYVDDEIFASVTIFYEYSYYDDETEQYITETGEWQQTISLINTSYDLGTPNFPHIIFDFGFEQDWQIEIYISDFRIFTSLQTDRNLLDPNPYISKNYFNDIWYFNY
jgi:hypothetical protein